MVALVQHETRMELSSSQTFNLYCLGDVHVGARGCDMEQFERDVEEVAADPYGYAIFMGDCVDGIWITDPRFDLRDLHDEFKGPTEVDYIIQTEVDWFCKRAAKIPAERVLGVLTGNHEEKVASHFSRLGLNYDPHYEIVNRLGVKSLGYCGYLRWRFLQSFTKAGNKRGYVIVVFAHHGYGGGRTKGGHAQALDHTLDSHEADLLLFGHRHQALADPKVRLSVNRRGKMRLQTRVMKATHTGTYLKTYQEGHANYGAKQCYKPVAIGMKKVRISPRVREITVEV